MIVPMARMTGRTQAIYDDLKRRLSSPLHRPGERFLSNRALAHNYAISYQTADRMLRQLVDEGLLVRRDRSGTYLPGRRSSLAGVQLIFHGRAGRIGSFGHKLLVLLTNAFAQRRVPVRVDVADARVKLRDGMLPIIWEHPRALARVIERQARTILLNDRPIPGPSALHIDSVSVDDFNGGVCAAEIVRHWLHGQRGGSVAVLAGPAGDSRSAERVAGFTSRLKAQVISAGGWDAAAGRRAARKLREIAPAALFACNDRLAEGCARALTRRGASVPAMIGFDDAPIAAQLNMTTIAIPWHEIARSAARLAVERIAGDESAPVQLVLGPTPTLRGIRPMLR
jgi:hypothetical protein